MEERNRESDPDTGERKERSIQRRASDPRSDTDTQRPEMAESDRDLESGVGPRLRKSESNGLRSKDISMDMGLGTEEVAREVHPESEREGDREGKGGGGDQGEGSEKGQVEVA